MKAQFNPVIALHARSEETGWYEVCRHPLNSTYWSDHDRGWIDELLNTGDWILVCGWSMWQILKD
jgi:hypothetical protein